MRMRRKRLLHPQSNAHSRQTVCSARCQGGWQYRLLLLWRPYTRRHALVPAVQDCRQPGLAAGQHAMRPVQQALYMCTHSRLQHWRPPPVKGRTRAVMTFQCNVLPSCN